MSDSFHEYETPRFTDATPSVAVLQARIAELEAQLNPTVWAGRLDALPNHLKHISIVVDLHHMSLRYRVPDDIVQPWHHGVLCRDVIEPMMAAVGLRMKYSDLHDNYQLEEL